MRALRREAALDDQVTAYKCCKDCGVPHPFVGWYCRMCMYLRYVELVAR